MVKSDLLVLERSRPWRGDLQLKTSLHAFGEPWTIRRFCLAPRKKCSNPRPSTCWMSSQSHTHHHPTSSSCGFTPATGWGSIPRMST